MPKKHATDDNPPSGSVLPPQHPECDAPGGVFDTYMRVQRDKPYYLFISVLYAVVLGLIGFLVFDVVQDLYTSSKTSTPSVRVMTLDEMSQVLSRSDRLVPDTSRMTLGEILQKSSLSNNHTQAEISDITLGELVRALGMHLKDPQTESIRDIKLGDVVIAGKPRMDVLKSLTLAEFIDDLRKPRETTSALIGKLFVGLAFFLYCIYSWFYFSRLFIYHVENAQGETWSYVLAFVVIVAVSAVRSIADQWAFIFAGITLTAMVKTIHGYLRVRAEDEKNRKEFYKFNPATDGNPMKEFFFLWSRNLFGYTILLVIVGILSMRTALEQMNTFIPLVVFMVFLYLTSVGIEKSENEVKAKMCRYICGKHKRKQH